MKTADHVESLSGRHAVLAASVTGGPEPKDVRRQPAFRFRLSALAWLLLAVSYLPLRADGPAVARKPGQPTTTTKSRTFDFAPSAVVRAVFEKPVPVSVEDLRAIQSHVRKLVAKVTPSTVAVRVGRAQGSGVIVSEDGYVLTAAHVAGAPGRPVTITLADGRRVKGKTLGSNTTADAGLMKITEKGKWPFVEMGDAKSAAVGTWCLATGHPGGYQKDRPPVVRLGRVVWRRQSLMQTDCILVGGDSGGPLFDMQGRVIGIHSRISMSLTSNYHVPIADYSANWDRMAAGERWGDKKPPTRSNTVLGVDGEKHEKGCRITDVPEGYPAHSAGLKVGDVIVTFGGKPVKNIDELAALVGKKQPGDMVTVEILRDDKKIEKNVILARRR